MMPATFSSVIRKRQYGVSLIELMIGVTLGLLIITGLTAVFVNSSRARAETEKTSQQIENGRYAAQLLIDELQLAGYYGELNPTTATVPTPAAMPDPCSIAAADLNNGLALPVQGYDNGAGLPASCSTLLSDRKSNTDVLVIRRTSTCIAGVSGCGAMDVSVGVNATGTQYFQSSRCSTEVTRFVVGIGGFTLKDKDCVTVVPNVRAYFSRIYFVANNNKAGDGIPTLKMIDMAADANFRTIPLVTGIEQMQVEYGVDTDADGTPEGFTADAGNYPYASPASCAGAACQTRWRNVTAVKLHILSRNTQSTLGWQDTRTYQLGYNVDGVTPNTMGADNANYKRHVYTTVVRLNNVAGRIGQ